MSEHRKESERVCKKGGTHAWPRHPERDGKACLKCGKQAVKESQRA